MKSENDTKHLGAFVQFKALLVRNFIIKKREKRKSITELTAPLFYISVLAIIRLLIRDTTYDAITKPHDGVKLTFEESALLDGSILVTPNNTKVRSLVEDIKLVTKNNLTDVTYFATEFQLEAAYRQNETATVALVFSDDPIKNPSYKIRINPKIFFLVSPSTLFIKESQCRMQLNNGLENGFSCPTNSYFECGFLQLQTAIDLAIIKGTTNDETPLPIELYLESFPRNLYVSAGTTVLRSIIPLYMVFAWAQFVQYMMILIVEEKEKKIKDGMKMMGLMGGVYWLSWVTIYSVYVLLLAIICIIVLPLAKVFRHANLFLLLILFILYGLSAIVLALMLTPFFNKAKVAGIVGQLLQIALGLLFYVQVYLGDQISPLIFWILGLFSPCAFSFAIDKVILFDFSAGGLSWNNIWDGDGLPFAGSLIMITFDIFLYLALGFYFDNVIPSEFGTKHKPWFIFQKSTWFGSGNSTQTSLKYISTDDGAILNPDVESVSSDLKGKRAICIQNLEKIFSPNGKNPVHAVNGISLDIYEGQITTILGHNGAGKTTLFNILTGLIEPSEGFASIFGWDVSNQNTLWNIRKRTGVCPQNDILFVKLTPREHLEFYAKIKGIPNNLIDMKVEEMLSGVDLGSKADALAETLSGGQKRKLSIAIALIGDPKIVFLDEPTAGIDAYSRRHLWSLLKKQKQGRVIILTTHSMDEADILADRIAIISKGKLRCCGTSVFLKNRFGLGYHLTLVKSDKSSLEEIVKVIKSSISKSEFVRHSGKEISFLLPANLTGEFPHLFTQLNHHSTDGTTKIIDSYGISMTTLEEVFLALSKDEIDSIATVEEVSKTIIGTRSSHEPNSPLETSPPINSNHVHSAGFDFLQVQTKRSSWRCFKALVKLRFLNLMRQLGTVIFLVIFPLLFVIVSIALANGASSSVNKDEIIELNPAVYSSSPVKKVLVSNETNLDLSSFYEVLNHFHLVPESYNGNYSFLYENQNHFGAFNLVDEKQKILSNVTTLVNSSFAHSLPILVNIISNSLYRSVMNKSDQESYINVSSQQLPLFEDGDLNFDLPSYFSPVMIGFAFTMIPAGLVIDFVYDREMNGRNMLRLNGVSFNLYFSSFFVVVGFLYSISYFGLLIIIQSFQVPSLVFPPAFSTIALLYLLYMPYALLFSGCMSYLYDKQETAQQFYPTLATTLGLVCYTVIMIVDLLKGPTVATPIHDAFSILCPFYIPFGALYYVNKIYLTCSLSGTCHLLTSDDYATQEIIIMFVVCIVGTFVFYGVLRIIDTLKYEGNLMAMFFKKKKGISNLPSLVHHSENEDKDVIKEREEVYSCLSSHEEKPVLLYDIEKTYKKGISESKTKKCGFSKCTSFTAVKSVSLQVNEGEVFGLLGPNGAGKTSTLKILTAEEAPTRGQVQLCGCDISSSNCKAFENLGYCPQHDCLWPSLTVAEHIECFAEISGIPQDQVKGIVDAYIEGLEIKEHKNKKSKKCSGGTKRKLSYIISMLGHKKLVLLDEPSSGMDPQSKRFLWNSILTSFEGNRSAILSTHSMEEAEALCSRIGILVRGELRCIGSVQHLKNKFGSGYSLEVKSSCKNCEIESNLISNHSQVKATLLQLFPNATIDEEFEERIICKIPRNDIGSLGVVFSSMETLKQEGVIEEYGLSQTTLEQVFLQFADLQDQEDDIKLTEIS